MASFDDPGALLERLVDAQWPTIARQAWRQYQRRGRGAIVFKLDAPGSNDQEPLRYLTFRGTERDIAQSGLGKLHELVREVRSGGHKALVFSQYTKLLRLIKQEFDELELPYFSLEGRTPQKRRKQRVDAFQESEDSCFFLISLKAGGTGLNLTAADYVFILDPWWNPAVEMQAVDRTHRIGQQKKVVSYRLISEGSVEEKVLSLQEKKQELVSSVLSGSNDLLGNLTRKDLEHLFS